MVHSTTRNYHSKSSACANGLLGNNMDPSLQILVDLRLSKADMARHLNISRPTLYKKLREANISINKYRKHHITQNRNGISTPCISNTFEFFSAELDSNISDQELDEVVKEIKENHPSAGEVMVQGHLSTRGIHVQRRCVRKSLHRVDAEGIVRRSRQTIKRRKYTVPGPNFLWHIDGTHKLIRWRLVVHMAIDGFSRVIIFGQCSNNNKATTVLALFEEGRVKYSNPHKIRTDKGGENVRVWEKMRELFPDRTNSVIVGSSVHNQRVERLHRDVNTQVINHFYNLFYNMESSGVLNPENPTDLYCLHYVFIPLINQRLQEFTLAHNNHKIGTERNYTPLQLFYLGNREVEEHENFYPPPALTEILPHVNVPAIISPISANQYEDLTTTINPKTYADPVSAYKDTATFIAECIVQEY